MTRSWDMYQPTHRASLRHPLLSYVLVVNKASAENAEQLAKEGKSETLSLAIGDPALDGNMPPPPLYLSGLAEAVESTRCNGYTSSLGMPELRTAVAEYWMRWFAPSLAAREETKLTQEDVVLSSGCSDALSIVLGAMVGPGDRFLLPQPFFPHYSLLLESLGATPVFFRCNPDKDWEVDFDDFQKVLDKTRAEGHPVKGVLLNNPNNPCGSNWSRQHVEEIVKLCEKNELPIVSDEIYAGITFDIHSPEGTIGSSPFTSVADIDSTATRLIASGASKRFGIPGDRLGWVIRVDPTHRGDLLFQGCRTLTARFLLPYTALQQSMIRTLRETDQDYYNVALGVLKRNAAYLYEHLRQVKGLSPVVPAGGMFLSVLLDLTLFKDEIKNDVDFASRLAAEENVHVFPGDPFHMKDAIRLTISRPDHITEECTRRIAAFCERHTK